MRPLNEHGNALLLMRSLYVAFRVRSDYRHWHGSHAGNQRVGCRGRIAHGARRVPNRRTISKMPFLAPFVLGHSAWPSERR